VTSSGRIITIGLSPAWDVSCRGRGLDWGRHPEIDEQVTRPAGKALNVSMALAWMGQRSVAAGLWGGEDRDRMQRSIRSITKLVRVRMTMVRGRTRQNITVVDTKNRREMHLRQESRLATPAAVRRLRAGLERIVRRGDYCVLAGAMPAGDSLEPVVDLVKSCRRRGGRIVVDAHGPVLTHLVDERLPWLIAPNVAELGELLGSDIKDTPAGVTAAGRTLLDKVPVVLISRGRRGVILLTRRGGWTGCVKTRCKVLHTVGCGDFLLAGFLASYAHRRNARTALATAVKVASARAWGWTEMHAWPAARQRIDVGLARI
jgi:1-phosphofructokinase family hexose kinase